MREPAIGVEQDEKAGDDVKRVGADNQVEESTELAFRIAASMVISMMAAAVSGVIIPILLSAAGQDPAQSSSIILTTVTDVMGFFSFLGLATLFSRLL